eukprot:gene11136-11289_t
MSDNIGTGSFRYHIAIDFGTHGSGFAYSAAADGDAAAKTFEYWEGQRGSPAPKTRTALLYKLSNVTKPTAWGWEAINQYADLPESERKGFTLLENFKLYLMPDDFDLPQLPAGLSIRKLVGDFLSCLISTINSTLDASYGSRYRPSAARWCLTVPAGLSQGSMAIMREAAMDAGIIASLQSASLVIATEPEAAALAAQQRKDLMGLTAGGKFMVIDMGGGTVDMTIHKVDAVLGGQVTLSEVTHRECLPEGATRVDHRFLEHLSSVLGEDAISEWLTDKANTEDYQELLYGEWETCKCAFDSTNTLAIVQVNLPYSLAYSLSDGVRAKLEAAGSADKLMLPHNIMASLFNPSLDKVIARALQMLARAGGADTIVLVGGFSSSRYAMRYLRAALEVHGRPVVAPSYRRSAVLEGGVWYSRYPSAIAARCSNMTYGVRTAVPWQTRAPSKVWLPHKQRYRCVDGFSPYVAKDELVKSGSVISKGFVPLYPAQTGVNFDIYGCLHKNAKYTTEDTMVKISTVRIDIPPGSYTDPDSYSLTAHFSFGEAQITVRCVDEQTGQDRHTVLLFDSSEAIKDNLSRGTVF